MSAEALGKQLLEEVQEESLSQLLKSLRDITVADQPRLGIKSLDIVIDAFENPPITRQQAIHRDLSSPDPTTTSAVPRRPTLIELTGATACSGKTQLLYYIISIALLPTKYRGIALNGQQQAVVLFDLSSRLSVLRFRDIMYHYITLCSKEQGIPITTDILDALISNSLMHLHVYKPHSTASLISTLSNLRPYLLARPSGHLSSSRPLGLLALSDISAFYYQDRLESEAAALSAPNTPNTENLIRNSYRALVSKLKELCSTFSCTLVATNYGLAPTSTVMGHAALKPHLPSVWHKFVTVSFVVERDSVKKFGPGMSVEEAESESGARWEAVKNARFRAWVNWYGAEEWKEGVREAVKTLLNAGRMEFQIDEKGVMVKDRYP